MWGLWSFKIGNITLWPKQVTHPAQIKGAGINSTSWWAQGQRFQVIFSVSHSQVASSKLAFDSWASFPKLICTNQSLPLGSVKWKPHQESSRWQWGRSYKVRRKEGQRGHGEVWGARPWGQWVCARRCCKETKDGGPEWGVGGEDSSGREESHVKTRAEDFQILLRGPWNYLPGENLQCLSISSQSWIPTRFFKPFVTHVYSHINPSWVEQLGNQGPWWLKWLLSP